MTRTKPQDDRPICDSSEDFSLDSPREDDDEKSFWEELGVSPPEYRSESEAPKVDRSLLLEYLRGELPEFTARAVEHLIDSFRSWSRAHAESVAEEYLRKRDQNC
jgi:hypothetical protein